MIEHDRLFKELLTLFIYDFIELMLPELHDGLEPGSIDFIDKEMFTELGLGQRREADLLAKARVRGVYSFLLLHVEHQAQHQKDFARRMFRYFSILYERYDMPIYPVALLSYPTPQDPAPSEYTLSCFGLETLVFQYRVVQLNQMNWRDFIRRPNPVAAALMSRMRIAEEDRPKVKIACLRVLTNSGVDRARASFISGFIEQYLTLTQEEKREFDAELDKIEPEEKETLIKLTNSWIEEGREEGRQDGARETLLAFLEARFGPLSESTLKRLATLHDPNQLKQLAARAAVVDSLEDFLAEL